MAEQLTYKTIKAEDIEQEDSPSRRWPLLIEAYAEAGAESART